VTVLALTWLAGCLPPTGLPDREVAWSEVAISASGLSELEGVYHHRTEPGRGDIWRVRTDRTEGVVRSPGAPDLRFDSASPRPADPWPLVLQHAIAAVPADVRVDADGRPEALVDPEAWSRRAREAIASVDLPADSGASLIDPDGFVTNLARTFPGVPEPRQTWTRDERVAGLMVQRSEDCGRAQRRAGGATVRCEGECIAHDGQAGDLFATTCWTEVTWDDDGLRRLETGYSGTRLTMGDADEVLDMPVAGQRLLVRNE